MRRGLFSFKEKSGNALLQFEGLFDFAYVVEFLPRKGFHVYGFHLTGAILEGQLLLLGGTPHVAVSGSVGVDWLTELKARLDGVGAHIEDLRHLFSNLRIGHLHLRRTVGINVDVRWLSYADGVRHLHEDLSGHTGGNEIFSDVARCVRGRTIYLTRVFAGESSTTVSAFTAVGIDDDLTSGEAGISVGATDYELTRWVYVIGDVFGEQLLEILLQPPLHFWNNDADDVFLDFSEHFLVGVEVIVLGRNHDGVDADRLVVVVVLDGHLALGVRAEVLHFFACLTDSGQFLQDAVAQIEGQRHVVFGFVGGVTKHHSLITSTLVFLLCPFYALVDVRALFVDSGKHATTLGFEHVLRLGVADAFDDVARKGLNVEVSFRFHFSGKYYLAGSDQRFAGNLRRGVKGEEMINEVIADLVGYFVRVTFGNRFRSKEIRHKVFVWCAKIRKISGSITARPQDAK